MATVKAISESIESISLKKEKLRKAFEDLQSHSSSLTSFTLQWKDIETHFDSIEKSIQDSFKDLESKINIHSPKPSLPAKLTEPLPAIIRHPKLKSLCAKMDGKGFSSYLIANRKDLATILTELVPALTVASDPAKLVLDAMEGFQLAGSEGDLAGIGKTCIALLERLMKISPEIKDPVKEEAMKLAMEWKEKLGRRGNLPLEGLGFVLLLATYDLDSVCNVDEVLGVIVRVCCREHTKRAIMMCPWLGLSEKIPDLITKLIKNGKRIDAVDFIHAFNLVDKFPPLPLLVTHIKASRRHLIRRETNSVSQNGAMNREISTVRAVIKCLKEHKLESSYPIDSLQKRVKELDKMMKVNREAAKAAPPAAKERDASATVNPTTTSITPIQQQTQTHLMADPIQPYSGSSVTSYEVSVGPSTAYDHPGSSSISGTAPVGYGQARSCPSDAAIAPGFHDRPLMGYGGYPGSAGFLQSHQLPGSSSILGSGPVGYGQARGCPSGATMAPSFHDRPQTGNGGYPGLAGFPQPHQPPSYYQ